MTTEPQQLRNLLARLLCAVSQGRDLHSVTKVSKPRRFSSVAEVSIPRRFSSVAEVSIPRRGRFKLK